MNKFTTACVIITLSFQFAATGNAVEQSGKPNVLMICIDDLNDWVGFLGGHPQALTRIGLKNTFKRSSVDLKKNGKVLLNR